MPSWSARSACLSPRRPAPGSAIAFSCKYPLLSLGHARRLVCKFPVCKFATLTLDWRRRLRNPAAAGPRHPAGVFGTECKSPGFVQGDPAWPTNVLELRRYDLPVASTVFVAMPVTIRTQADIRSAALRAGARRQPLRPCGCWIWHDIASLAPMTDAQGAPAQFGRVRLARGRSLLRWHDLDRMLASPRAAAPAGSKASRSGSTAMASGRAGPTA